MTGFFQTADVAWMRLSQVEQLVDQCSKSIIEMDMLSGEVKDGKN